MLREVLRRGIAAADRLSGGAASGVLSPLRASLGQTSRVRVRLGTVEGEVAPGTTVLEACLALGVDLEHCCGGEATCGTCRITVLQGPRGLSRIDGKEANALSAFAEGERDRLACQARIVGPVAVDIPDDWRAV